MKKLKLKLAIYAILSITAVTLLAVYSRAIAQVVAPIAELAAKLFI